MRYSRPLSRKVIEKRAKRKLASARKAKAARIAKSYRAE